MEYLIGYGIVGFLMALMFGSAGATADARAKKLNPISGYVMFALLWPFFMLVVIGSALAALTKSNR